MNETGPVVKVGGSLLHHQRLPSLLSAWLAQQATRPSFLIAGGGPWAEAIRQADRRFHLGDEASHWLCVQAMGITARILAAILPRARVVTDTSLVSTERGEMLILDVSRFLRHDESRLDGAPLPHNWSCTSDSIAARVAAAVGASELVLLKSSLPSRDSTVHQASRAGFVDAFLPTCARHLPRIRCVHLGQSGSPELVWDGSSL